jgi:hypothetical protein
MEKNDNIFCDFLHFLFNVFITDWCMGHII